MNYTESGVAQLVGDFFASPLENALDQTIEQLDLYLRDLVEAGLGTEDLAKMLATCPPFKGAVLSHVRNRLPA
jgi:hypothetical protein